MNLSHLLIVFLIFVFILSTILNSISIRGFFKLKKKINADYIKLEIFIVNLVFTFIAIPYYIAKETRILSNSFLCHTFFGLTDSIMFIYNNLLILMAIDRFIFICTKFRYKIKNLMLFFHCMTFLIASSSVCRIFSDDCYYRNFSYIKITTTDGFTNNSTISNNSNTINAKNILIEVYDFFIVTVMSINWISSFIFYSIIVFHVYRSSKIITNNIGIEIINIRQIRNKRKQYLKRFKKSKHWKVTVIFIKVNIFLLILIINIQYYKFLNF